MNISVASFLVLSLSGLVGKAFSKIGLTTKIHHQETLHHWCFERPESTPLITVSNHNSTMDDPLLWSMLFTVKQIVLQTKKLRWVMGARELMFTNSINRSFFGAGRVVPIVRGEGLNQSGVQTCIDKLQQGGWVHIFSEGRVNQSGTLLKFRWGIGKLIYEPDITPVVLPIYHHGLENILPEGRYNNVWYKWLWYHIPRVGHSIQIVVGEPIDFTEKVKEYKQLGTPQNIAYTEITQRVEDCVRLMQQNFNKANARTNNGVRVE